MKREKRVVSIMLASSLVLGSASMSFAAIPTFTIKFGDQAFDLTYAMQEENANLISDLYVGAGYDFEFKDLQGKWVDSLNNDVDTSTFPEVTYTDVDGEKHTYAAGDGDLIDTTELAVTSVSAINATTVEIAFNQPVTKASAESATYTVTKIVGNSSITVSSKVLSADGRTVTLSLATEMVNSENGYALSIAKDVIKTAAGTKLAATEVIFDGVADVDTIKPAVQRAEYFAGNNTLVVKFNKPVSATDTDVDETKITINGTGSDQTVTLTETAYSGATGSTDEITFAVPAAVATYDAPLTVEFGAEFVQDVSATPLTSDAQTIEAATATKPAIVDATYDEQTDRLVINFNKTVDVSTLDTSMVKVKLNGASSIAVGGEVVTTADGSTVEIEGAFTEPATVTSSTIELLSGAVKDLDGNASIAQTGATLIYTDDVVVPTLVSASYNDLADELTLVFSEKVKVDNTNTNFDKTGVTVGGVAVATVKSPADSDTVIVTPGATKPSADNKISIAKDAVQDMSGNKIEKIEDVTADVTDLTKPTYVVFDDDGDIETADYTNQVTVVFSEKVDETTAETISNYDIFAQSNEAVKLPITIAQLGADAKTVTLTTENQTGIKYGVKVANVTDLAGNVLKTPTDSELATDAGANNDYFFNGQIGTTDTTKPSLATAAIVDKDKSGDVSKGDELKLTFDEELNVNFANITVADFVVTDSTDAAKDEAEAFGTGATFGYGDDSTEIVVTLGTLGSNRVVVGDKINVETDNDILDVAGNRAQAGEQVVTAPADTPKLASVVYTDTNTDGTVNDGDTVRFNFTQKVDIDNNTALSDIVDANSMTAKLYGTDIADIDGAATGLTSVDYIDITIDDNTGMDLPTLVVGTSTETGKDAAAVTNGWGNDFDALTTGLVITSEDTAAPVLVSAQVVKGAGMTGTALEATDTIVLTFSEAVDEAVAKTGHAAMYIKTSSQVQLAYAAGDGDDIAQTGATNNEITITIATGDGWIGTEIDGLTFTTISKIFTDASGNKADLTEIGIVK